MPQTTPSGRRTDILTGMTATDFKISTTIPSTIPSTSALHPTIVNEASNVYTVHHALYTDGLGSLTHEQKHVTHVTHPSIDSTVKSLLTSITAQPPRPDAGVIPNTKTIEPVSVETTSLFTTMLTTDARTSPLTSQNTGEWPMVGETTSTDDNAGTDKTSPIYSSDGDITGIYTAEVDVQTVKKSSSMSTVYDTLLHTDTPSESLEMLSSTVLPLESSSSETASKHLETSTRFSTSARDVSQHSSMSHPTEQITLPPTILESTAIQEDASKSTTAMKSSTPLPSTKVHTSFPISTHELTSVDAKGESMPDIAASTSMNMQNTPMELHSVRQSGDVFTINVPVFETYDESDNLEHQDTDQSITTTISTVQITAGASFEDATQDESMPLSTLPSTTQIRSTTLSTHITPSTAQSSSEREQPTIDISTSSLAGRITESPPSSTPFMTTATTEEVVTTPISMTTELPFITTRESTMIDEETTTFFLTEVPGTSSNTPTHSATTGAVHTSREASTVADTTTTIIGDQQRQ
uniref:Mucin-17-like n=1 Tax=Saccoglossus kowalevskii TaxID=10224 RepID=A0ABM0MKZ2_SACKO|nr:PREDICTED: mucin-17-like [Saccoglossus kowalevskii]